MPGRRDIFANGGTYHIFNKTIDNKKTFKHKNNCRAFLSRLPFYQSAKAVISFSKFKSLPIDTQNKIKHYLSFKKYFKVEILAYCLMPNHYHLLVKQILDKGIQKFMTDVSNSFTRFSNIKSHRKGPLFLPRFRSRSITSDEQLIHVSRYIHLNPYSAEIINNPAKLQLYDWSSYKYYITNDESSLINTQLVLSLFNNSKSRYENFVRDHADYQRSLEQIKYIDKWQI